MKNFLKMNVSSISLFLITVLILVGVSFIPSSTFTDLLSQMCYSARSYVGIAELLFLAFLIIAGAAFYDKKIGGPTATKEYSLISWLCMIFACGMGVGLVYYGLSEPILHAYSNPYHEGVSSSYGYALALFNWGIHPWVLYCTVGFLVAYAHYEKKKPLRMSSLLPDRSPQFIKTSVDVISAIGILAGLTTSLGLGVNQISLGIQHVFGISINPYILIIVIGLVATLSVASGLQKGIKMLSNFTINTSMLLMAFTAFVVIIMTNTNYIDYFCSGISIYVTEFFTFSDPFNSSATEWSAAWSVFYQLWFASWAIFVGVFLAKISKGRKYSELIFAGLIVPTVFTALWFLVFGGAGFNTPGMYEAVQESIPTSIFTFYELLVPSLSIIISLVVLVILTFFFITSSDSGSYVIATLVNKDKAKEVSTSSRVFWATVQIVVTSVLFYQGGLSLVQAASVLLGIPIVALMGVGIITFISQQIKKK